MPISHFTQQHVPSSFFTQRYLSKLNVLLRENIFMSFQTRRGGQLDGKGRVKFVISSQVS